jgi:hypothetical protein
VAIGAAGVVSKLRDSTSISEKISDIGSIFDNDIRFLYSWLAESSSTQGSPSSLAEFEANRPSLEGQGAQQMIG